MECDAIIVAKIDTHEANLMTQDCIDSLMDAEDDIHINLFLEFDDGMREFNYNNFLCHSIEQGKSEWILLCNNDLIFGRGFLSEIFKVENKTKAVSFSAWSDGYHEKYFPVARDYYVGYRISIEFSGWFICIKRSVLDEINFCSPENQRCSFWFSDNILRDLLQAKRYPHILCRHSKVLHLFSKTLNLQTPERREELTSRQKGFYGARNLKQ